MRSDVNTERIIKNVIYALIGLTFMSLFLDKIIVCFLSLACLLSCIILLLLHQK